MNSDTKVYKIVYHEFLSLNSFRFCATHVTTHQRLANQGANFPFGRIELILKYLSLWFRGSGSRKGLLCCCCLFKSSWTWLSGI